MTLPSFFYFFVFSLLFPSPFAWIHNGVIYGHDRRMNVDVVKKGYECFHGKCDYACDKGPYILTNVLDSSHEGFGSSMQRQRLGIILEAATGYEWVRTFHNHIRHNQNFTAMGNLLEMTGFCHNVTCNICSLVKLIEEGKLKTEDVEYHEKITRNNPILDDDVLRLCRAAGKYNNDTGKGVTSSLLPAHFPHHHHHNNLVYNYSVIYMIGNPACSLPLVASAYKAHLQQELTTLPLERLHAQLPFPPDPPPPAIRRGRVVIHVRWGDVRPKATVTQGNLNKRIVSLPRMMSVVKVMLEVLTTEVDFYVIAEANGDESYFVELQKLSPRLQFINGGADTITRDLEMMAQADVLVVSNSAFAVIGAAMNEDGIIVAENNGKYKDWQYFRTAPVLKGLGGLTHGRFKEAVQNHTVLSQLIN